MSRLFIKDPVLDQVLSVGEEALRVLAYEIVHLEWSQDGHQKILRVYIERSDKQPVLVEDCAKASQALGIVLEAQESIGSLVYTLEVSSPGVNRPLTREKDFAEHLGKMVKIECFHLVSGRKRFHGHLQKFTDREIAVEVEGKEYLIPFGEIKRARLDYFASVNSEQFVDKWSDARRPGKRASEVTLYGSLSERMAGQRRR